MDGLPSYYQKSINTILQSVIDVHASIMTEEEKGLLNSIIGLPDNPQRLLYRLYLRKPGWVRMKRLVYKDIESVQVASAFLYDASITEGILSRAFWRC